MGVSKVVLGDETLIDLTSDSVSPGNLLEGATAHGADGEEVIGGVVVTPMYTGTKAAIEAAIAAGQIPEDAIVNITDDEETSSFQTQINQINDSLTNENGETFRYGYQDGKRGVWVKEADTDVFVPFKSDLVVSDIWQYTETSPNYDTTHNIATDDMSKYSSIILSSSWAWTKYSNASEVKVIPISEFKNGQTYRVDNYYNGSIQPNGYAEITYVSDTTIALKRGGYSAAFILFVK